MMSVPPIAHSRPTLDDHDARAVTKVVRSGWLAQGARVEAFERKMAAFVGVRGGVAVNSGTAALKLALLAIGVKSYQQVKTMLVNIFKTGAQSAA
mgnify:CR=1 FL=1